MITFRVLRGNPVAMGIKTDSDEQPQKGEREEPCFRLLPAPLFVDDREAIPVCRNDG